MNRSIEQQVFIDEYNLVEKPAIDLFKKLNYNYVYGKTLNKEPQQFFLTEILKTKIKDLNPWLTDTNLNKMMVSIQ